MKTLLSAFLLMSLVACSGSKSTNESDSQTGVELADTEEFVEEEDFQEDEVADNLEEEVADEFEPSEEEATADAMTEEAPEVIEDEAPEAMAAKESFEDEAPAAISGESATWSVASNETLMLIAFKIYGDYDRWRELASMNRNVLGSSNNVSAGMQLNYKVPAEPFVWNPEGNPYLIKRGDTLAKISTTTYGTRKFWRNIFDNNRPLIKNPHEIFAGFTLYTPIIDGRGVANQ